MSRLIEASTLRIYHIGYEKRSSQADPSSCEDLYPEAKHRGVLPSRYIRMYRRDPVNKSNRLSIDKRFTGAS
jgi:hypothetical protein